MTKRQDRKDDYEGFWSVAFDADHWRTTIYAFLLLPFSLALTWRYECQYLTDPTVEITMLELWGGRLLLLATNFLGWRWLFDPILRIKFLLPLHADLLQIGKLLLSIIEAVIVQFCILGVANLMYNTDVAVAIALFGSSLALVVYLYRRLSRNRKQDLRSTSLDDIDI